MLSTTIREEHLPLELQQQIDACCDKYEQALQRGQTPEISDYLRNLPSEGHAVLQREFTAIELEYNRTPARRDSEALHLRCPHCQNQVELLDDAKLEEITCRSCGDTFSLIDEDASKSGLHEQQRIAHFELINRLGTGGFGSVWEARDTELDRLVALKIPRKSQLSTRETEQFFREARTAAQLKHPHIVPVHEVGKDGATIFIVTDLIHGVPMSDWLKAVRPTARETADLCATIAEALDYAHQRGVIHRDLKPSNVMLDEQHQPHIMDFGLAKRELGEITMTVDGTILGTPAYMSPEQAMGKMQWVDRRTDVYSLGVMLFQMLTGELPFRGTAQQQIQQRVVDDAPDPRRLNTHVPLDLATITLRCLERDASRRFATAAEFAAELRRYLAGEPIRSRPISTLNRAVRWARRKPALATAGVLTCVLAIAGPVAAWSINDARVENARLAQERLDIIDYENDLNDQIRSELTDTQQKLNDILIANPGIEDRSHWHRKFIAELIEQNQAARQQLLERTSPNSESEELQLAQQHLGWQYLLDSAGEHEEALRHGVVARDALIDLCEAQPEDLNVRVLLAECLMEVSNLQHELDQRDAAEESAQRARGIRAALAKQFPTDLRFQMDHARALGGRIEFDTLSADEDVLPKQFGELAAMYTKLKQNLQVRSSEFYGIACYLTQRENLLRRDLAPVATGELLEQDEVE